ncbi:MAG: FAD-dependent oxidoreductase [Bryobacteraceae bacterium]
MGEQPVYNLLRPLWRTHVVRFPANPPNSGYPMAHGFPKSPLSLWLAEYGPYEPSPPLQGDATVDVAVVGGGFTGMATAHTLLKEQPGIRVAVLEHECVGYGASGRNGSFSMTGKESERPVVPKMARSKARHRRSGIRDGFAQVDGHREIRGASHTQKIIVKPCAGKRPARFDRGY